MAQEAENRAAHGAGAPNSAGGGSRDDWHAPLPARLPKPTVAPALLAFGACLVAWGVLTSWAITSVGLVLFVLGVKSWVGDMRHEQRE